MTGYRLHVTCSMLLVTGFRFQDSSNRLQVKCKRLQTKRLHISCYRLHVKGYRLKGAGYKLPVARGLLIAQQYYRSQFDSSIIILLIL